MILNCPYFVEMRIELIHPMVVHFPIALLLVGFILRILSFFTRKKRSCAFLLPASWLVLAIGAVMAWVAVIAGELAANVVDVTLCNEDALDYHSTLGQLTAIGFTIALLFDGVSHWGLIEKPKIGHIFQILHVAAWILYCACAITLLITAALGGSLVFGQGAAVLRG
jgi:uncharacterized membrane protein